MAGVALVNPKYSFTDSLGAPLVGGTLDVFLAGTTTRTNTWQDKAQTTLNTNPIVLDARGECTLWADDTLTYRFVLKTALGVQLWDEDNISGANVSGTLVTFTQAGTGAVGRTMQNKARERVTPFDFGAVGDGTTNDQAAFEAALTYIKSQTKSLPGMVNGYSTPELYLPAGYKFLVTGGFNIGTDVHIIGNRSIIATASTYPYTQTAPIFTNVGYSCVFDGVVLFGGTNHIEIVTANANMATIDIRNCEFHEWSGTSVKVDTNSASTYLRINNNKFTARSASAVVLENRCDVCVFDDNWVEGPCTTFIKNYKGLYVRGMLGVPEASVAGAEWILNEGQMLVCTHNRFGGEAGARTAVTQSTGPGATNATKLVIADNEVWSTSFPVVHFTDIPDIVVFENNYGLNGTYPFSFDAAIPADTRNNLGQRNSWRVRDNQLAQLGGLRASTEDLVSANKVAMLQTQRDGCGTSTILSSEVVRNILYSEAGYTPSGGLGAGMANGTTTDLYGATVQTIGGVNGTSSFSTAWTAILSGLGAGAYTLLANVEAQGTPMQFNMHGSQQYRQENLAPGRYTLALPFYFDGTNGTSAGYSIANIPTGGTFIHGGLRIVSGRHDSYSKWNTEVYADAAPVAGYWRLGDRVIRVTPTVGQPKAWVCTVAGTPGTWVSEGNL
jgi:hypothetical protein